MIAVRTKVKCTEHDGAHTGTVVAHLGSEYGIAWTNAPQGMVKTEAQRELAQAHAKHFMSTPDSAVVPA